MKSMVNSKVRTTMRGVVAFIFSLLALSAYAQDRSPAPEGAELYIVSPANGAVVKSPVTVVFGLKGMGVAPAGVDLESTGHHHLIIDTALPAMDTPIPADDKHLHFGKGQTETSVELAPGKHTLQLVLGNYLHIPHDPAMVSDVIEITVEE